MEYLQKCFYKTTNWNEDNIFSNVTATSDALLNFPIPNGLKLDSSSKSTDYSASSFTLSNFRQINGSLAYLYSSTPLINTMGTKDISLQDAIAGFRIIEPTMMPNYAQDETDLTNTPNKKPMLLYGRMYFPGSALEAMIIKRLSENTQFLIKCVSHPQLEKNGTVIVYLQNNTAKYSRELIYSTNESLIGVRCLYNWGTAISKSINPHLVPKFENSVVSLGTELWFAARSMSPGLSTALRYSTRSTSTGKPLTMTLAVNPILGHVSSTYTVKTSVASTFCSKYDFNFFSYASNLSLGFELYSYAQRKTPTPPAILNTVEEEDSTSHLRHNMDGSRRIRKGSYNSRNRAHFDTHTRDYHTHEPLQHKTTSSTPTHNSVVVTTAFQNLVNESDFSSVLKVSTSLRDNSVRLLWEGRLRDFLISAGTRVSWNPVTNTPEVNKLGITLSSNYGLKTALPSKIGKSHISFNDVDNYKGMPDVEKNSGHHYTQLMFQELGMPLRTHFTSQNPLFPHPSNKSSKTQREGSLTNLLNLNTRANTESVVKVLNNNPKLYQNFRHYVAKNHPKVLLTTTPQSEIIALVKDFLRNSQQVSKKENTVHDRSRDNTYNIQGTGGFSYNQRGRLQNTPNGIRNNTVTTGRIVGTKEAAIGGFVANVIDRSIALQTNYAKNYPGKQPRQFTMPFKINEAELSEDGSVRLFAEGIKTGKWSDADERYPTSGSSFANSSERVKADDESLESLLNLILPSK
ncbi:MDM10 [Candida theae]|uniref:Mitochondrial distribution and morphology protein 10 n=1 Tax=Candida theae TaxID=1198502 RepID=A0AAD5FZ94_9ASCO|nr:MDM10 [Candida theae]KAI5960529.1 MDM10 [Candida theae]